MNPTLEKHPPSETRYARANKAPYMNKKLSKENISSENRTFWKTVKLFLAEKYNKFSNITLIEDNQIFSQEKQITKIFNAIS